MSKTQKKRVTNLPRLKWPTLKTILPCNYQTLYLLSKPLKQIHPCLIALTPPLHMLSAMFILIKHIEISVQSLINFHLNSHAPFVLNHILEYISAIRTKCIVDPDNKEKGVAACSDLCTSCGLKVKKEVVHVSTTCNCKFEWCCNITCEKCSKEQIIITCEDPSPKYNIKNILSNST